MIDWSKITGFDWDAGNERKSEEKHGVSKVEARAGVFQQAIVDGGGG